MSDPTIYFYSTKGEYGPFSNFSAHRLFLKGKTWRTSEHYFQAQKFAGTEHEEELRLAESPMVVARMGRSRKRPLRKDWEAVKNNIMREAVMAKFTQNKELKDLLLSTGDATLVEHTTNDSYWADGGDGSGKNMLGIVLMEVREKLKAEQKNRERVMSDQNENLQRARLALEGLSVGDGFGEQCFTSDEVMSMRLETRQIPPPPWFFTDDTIMSISIVEVLQQYGTIEQDTLASAFAERYAADPFRGYGGTAHRILRAIGEGVPWEHAAGEAFDGMGSMGNGGAMRAAPVGAYFAEEGVATVVKQAKRSAAVTHAHEEGQAGAVAVALAAMFAVMQGTKAESRELLEFVLEHLAPGDTQTAIRRALNVPFSRSPAVVAQMLGSGEKVISQDTVPFSIWCAARHLNDYPSALWSTVSGLGDRDTTCAIVGGIVALAVGREGIPEDWIASREPLPQFN